MLCAEAALQGFPLWGHVPGSSSGSRRAERMRPVAACISQTPRHESRRRGEARRAGIPSEKEEVLFASQRRMVNAGRLD
jgi:hypothetical protein